MAQEFRLKGTSSIMFSSKLETVFGSLGDLEKKHEDWTKCDARYKKNQPSLQKEDPVTLFDHEFNIPRSHTQLDRRGQPQLLTCQPQTAFRLPGLPVPRRAPPARPDHQLHPEKWTKYSLSSVSATDLSESSNTSAAMSFLQELQQNNSEPYSYRSPTPESTSDQQRISFKKPRFESTAKPHANEPVGVRTTASAIHVMPEHVVGRSACLVRKHQLTPLKQSLSTMPAEEVEKSGHASIRLVELDHLEQSQQTDFNYTDQRLTKNLSTPLKITEKYYMPSEHRAIKNAGDAINRQGSTNPCELPAAPRSIETHNQHAYKASEDENKASTKAHKDDYDMHDSVTKKASIQDDGCEMPVIKRKKISRNIRKRDNDED